MQEINKDQLHQSNMLLFIHSPFCGTCHVAEGMLRQIELALEQDIFLNMNASLHPEFMMEHKIESVPCLFIRQEGISEKIYAFHSVANICSVLLERNPELFSKST